MPDVWVQRTGGARAERERHEWSDMLPVMLRSAVRGPLTQGRFRQPWSKRLILVKWVVRGQAVMRQRGQRLPFGPGEVAVYIPTEPHQFWAVAPNTEMCWFSVDGPLVEQFLHLLGVRAGVYDYGPPPIDKIDALIASLDDQSLTGCRHSSVLAIEMLYDLASRLPPRHTVPVVHQVRHLIQEGLGDPDLSAQQLASRLNYNRGALSRLFHQHTGITIIDCITQTRLQMAEMLLLKSDDRIGDVARKCGFRDISYFTRWIKKHMGRPPRELRAAGAEPNERDPATS